MSSADVASLINFSKITVAKSNRSFMGRLVCTLSYSGQSESRRRCILLRYERRTRAARGRYTCNRHRRIMLRNERRTFNSLRIVDNPVKQSPAAIDASLFATNFDKESRFIVCAICGEEGPSVVSNRRIH